MNGNYPSQKIDWKKYDLSTKILQEIKLYLSEKTIWQLSYTCFKVFEALGQFGGTGQNPPNGLGYTESIFKSSTLHLAPNEVFSLISIEAFQVIDQNLLIKWKVENHSLLHPFSLP